MMNNIIYIHNKMKRLTSCFILLFYIAGNLFAQGENNNWCFGRNNFGLTFNTNPPTWFTTDSTRVVYGSSSVSDASGNLLFYTNGAMVWNQNNQPMPNGTGLSGYPSSTATGIINGGGSKCGVLIIKSLSNANQYYIITTDSRSNNTNNAYYSLIDMTLDNGLGDVVPGQKNILLATDVAEGVIATRADGICIGYWVIIHKKTGFQYLAFRLDINGLSTTAVFSDGILAPGTAFPGKNTMCFNPAGDRLVRCDQASGIPPLYWGGIETAAFDNVTGQLSNFSIIQNSDSGQWHNPIFSPDGTKLYCGVNTNNNEYGYYQFNMALLPNIVAVHNSKALIDSTIDFTGGRIGPDNKLYISGWGAQFLSRIDYPNNTPATCGFVLLAVLMPTYSSGSGNYYNSTLELGSPALTLSSANIVTHQALDTGICPGQSLILLADTMYQSQVWSTGSTNDQETFTQPGTYWLHGIKGCTTYIDTFYIHSSIDTLISPTRDTTICFEKNLILTSPPDYESPVWSTGSTNAQETFAQPGTYWLCGIQQCTTHIDTFHIHYPDFEVRLGNDTGICTGTTLLLDVTLPGATSYLWQDGSPSATYTVSDEGNYSVAVTKDGCTLLDTISVGIIYPTLNIQEHDTTICKGERISLHALANPQSNFQWNTGSTESSTQTNAAKVYTVTATNVCGTLQDSILVQEKICPCIVFVPNAFTPNSDGKNDVLEVNLRCPLLSGYTFAVFNRYGQKMFQSSVPGQGWDGSNKGNPADAGTYFFYLKYKDGETDVKKKGDIMLIR